jgi:hypothetical protein
MSNSLKTEKPVAFVPEVFETVNRTEEKITDTAVAVTKLEKEITATRSKDKKTLEKLSDNLLGKKQLYHELLFLLENLTKIGQLSCGTEEDISMIPLIIKSAKKILEK